MFPKQRCQRCGKDEEDAWHRYYECPDNEDTSWQSECQQKWMQKSSWLGEYAVRCRARQPACLWQRGILPYNSAGRLAEDLEKEEFGRWKSSVWRCKPAGGGVLFTDGSGGEARHLPMPLRRVGAGAASFEVRQDSEGEQQLHSENFILAASRVPGKQTVPRAEVFAATTGVESQTWQLPGQTFSSWGVDAKYVLNGFSSGGGARKSRFGRSFGAGANEDLWQDLLSGQAAARVPKPHWVKSHCTLADVKNGRLPFIDYFGNALADAAAGVAAHGCHAGAHR